MWENWRQTIIGVSPGLTHRTDKQSTWLNFTHRGAVPRPGKT
ncbi:hypothetical protein ETAE_2716 [Edwardsiella piscicida]|uniref:Uncharacterized protein n=3 Tax=Edwardsiella TaxID=635 RepID=A0A0H3DV78_EDWTF|nr:hypothetical protein ETAE_2716 [Edwardsiella tarda EIB202]ADM42553.1 hypothetical protein ETAF_2450 [Edwardsiella tarda FL6-60]AIJ07291.1 Hypothetical protein ETEE_0820 [Edwardsiella anguillarum ET080813]